MNTASLHGIALDYAVAKCENVEFDENGEPIWFEDDGPDAPRCPYSPSTNWSQGGPIIEREVIALIHPKYDCWTAHCYDKTLDDESYTLDGPTPLIAAMRCYVAAKLGDEIEVPDQFTQGA